MSAQLAVVTVAFSSGDYLLDFVRSVAQATELATTVVIVDNGSDDGAPEAAERDFDNVVLITSEGNVGYGAAANRGVAAVDPDIEFVVVANPDVVWQPGSLDELLAAAKRWPRAGALGPLILEPDGTVYPSARRVPDLASGTGHALFSGIWPTNPWTASYRADQREPTERPVGWLSGSCLLLRRSAFDSVDGFDPRYFMFFEDVDLGDRLDRAGWLNVYVPSARVLHARGHVASKHPEIMLPAHHRSAYRFQADRHPGPLRAPLRVALRAGLALRAKVAVAAARRAG